MQLPIAMAATWGGFNFNFTLVSFLDAPTRVLSEIEQQLQYQLVSRRKADYDTNTIQIQYKYNGNIIQIQYKYNANTIQIQLSRIQYKYNFAFFCTLKTIYYLQAQISLSILVLQILKIFVNSTGIFAYE